MAVQFQGTQGQVFGPSGANHSQGLVPDPGASAGTVHFLREDATFQQISYSQISGAPTPNYVLLNTLSPASVASVSDTTSFTTVYNTYNVQITNLVPTTTSVTALLRLHNGGTFKSSGYDAIIGVFLASGFAGANPSTALQMSQTTAVQTGVNGGNGFTGSFNISSPSTSEPQVVGNGTHWNGSSQAGTFFGGFWNGVGSIDGFQLLFSAGSIASGTVKVYGIT